MDDESYFSAKYLKESIAKLSKIDSVELLLSRYAESMLVDTKKSSIELQE
jgi:hypothetical protein